MNIGWIGQGWIGKHYADDFEQRGLSVVRYALEEPYRANKGKIAECDIVFIAVPTPTTPTGFDDSIVREAVGLVGKGKVAVIKSTLLPGTTESILAQYPGVFVMHSPEFLVEQTAAHDAAHPERNIVGIPEDTSEYRQKAQEVLALLPEAPYARVMHSRDAEFIKYAGNCFLFTKVLYMNVLYDAVAASGANWEQVREAMIRDPRIGESHTQPVHQSWHAQSGQPQPQPRGAGGHCFIKDFEAFRALYQHVVADPAGQAMLDAMRDKNIALLTASKKDLDLLAGVYGNL